MEEKIKKTLAIFEDINIHVCFNEPMGCGHIVLRHRYVTFTVIDLLTKVVDLVAISCIDKDTYLITFMTK